LTLNAASFRIVINFVLNIQTAKNSDIVFMTETDIQHQSHKTNLEVI